MKIEVAKTKQCCRDLSQKCATTGCMAWISKGSDADYIDAQEQAINKGIGLESGLGAAEPVDCGYCGLVAVNN